MLLLSGLLSLSIPTRMEAPNENTSVIHKLPLPGKDLAYQILSWLLTVLAHMSHQIYLPYLVCVSPTRIEAP